MITVRRSEERSHVRHRAQEGWLTYYSPSEPGWLPGGFGPLELLKEDRIPPAVRVPRYPPYDAEVVTYVLEGVLAHENSKGGPGVIRAGEFQRASTAQGVGRREWNGSRKEWTHVVQIWLRQRSRGLDGSSEPKRFCAAERRGVLCVVASPDARNGSLRIHQDALLHSTVLFPGQHVVHELTPGRRVWVQVLSGEAALGDIVLARGDGAGIWGERSVSLTAREESELLLIDLGE